MQDFGWGITIRLILLGALLLGLYYVVQPAKSDHVVQSVGQQCGPHEELIKQLAVKYHEVRLHTGTTSPGTTVRRIMEIYVSKKGSWTILVTSRTAKHPNGFACIIAAGQNWRNTPQGEPV